MSASNTRDAAPAFDYEEKLKDDVPMLSVDPLNNETAHAINYDYRPPVYSERQPDRTPYGAYPTSTVVAPGNYAAYEQSAGAYNPGIVSAQPTYIYVQPTPLSNPPNDYLGYSIFVTLCCCWLIGLFAIIKSNECRTASSVGNMVLAQQKSKEAKKLAHIALGVGIVVSVASAVIMGVYYGVVLSRATSYP